MIEQVIQTKFQQMLESNHYITYKEYNNFLTNYKEHFENSSSNEEIKEIASNGYMKIEQHNAQFIAQKLIEEKDYFDHMFQKLDVTIELDEAQRKAILNEDDYSLIIAGAGAGKTTTMAAKVKYLIERKQVDPAKIAVISYTNQATEELKDRIHYGFEIPVDIMTFHSLGMKMIRKLFRSPLRPISEKEQKEIVITYIKEVLFPNKELFEKYISMFNKYDEYGYKMFSKGFVENYRKFETFDDYFRDYKRRKQEQNKDNLKQIIDNYMEGYLKQQTPKSLKNETMRSKSEARIANFLFINGIEYQYEEPYPEKVDEGKSYAPDFTIFVNDIPLYIEYYGLSSYYTGNGIQKQTAKKYEDIRTKKRNFHKIHENYFIELDYRMYEDGKPIHYLKALRQKLNAYNVVFQPRTLEEIYDQILNNNVVAEFFHFVDFIVDIINQIRSSSSRENFWTIITDYIMKLDVDWDTKKQRNEEAKLIQEIYQYYEKELLPNNQIDFSDMIFYANKFMKNLHVLDYEYLIIDEYQDISVDRYEFAHNLSQLTNAKVISVGDDWQTIFSFAGSRIDLFLKYNSSFPGARQLFINNTYRSSQELIDCAGNFIMQNPMQMKKSLFSNKRRENPFKLYIYNQNQYEIVNEIVKQIYEKNKDDHILILARKNKHIEKLLETSYFKEGIGTRIISEACPNAIIDAMSVHKAKGLGADQVILLNVTNKDFPCPEKEGIWLSNLFKEDHYKEDFPYAEDRRIFYVALTRTKNDVYLLVPESKLDRSPFIEEILE